MAKEVGDEYASSLADLTVNSKPLITMLTILAEENIEHAGVIVQAVENHLEKVRPEIKLPVLYLVDSIIKNVGGAYTEKFAQSIVNMFTRTFKQVDEKTRSQMFKLRDTWHNIFPAGKLYQLDVKVNLVDPAWPIQATPATTTSTSTIHINPNFFQKPALTSTATVTKPNKVEDEETMRNALALKQQELLLLQTKKKELELRHLADEAKKILEQSRVNPALAAAALPLIPGVNPAVNPVQASNSISAASATADSQRISAKQRLGPPVTAPKSASSARIPPVSSAMLGVRRDPRLTRRQPQQSSQPPASQQPHITNNPHINSQLFDIKPPERNERITKRKNVITIDVQLDAINKTNKSRDPRMRRDPRLEKKSRREIEKKIEEAEKSDNFKESEKHAKVFKPKDAPSFPIADPKKISKLPPIPKISRHNDTSPKHNDKIEDDNATSPTKRKKESISSRNDRRIKRKDTKEKTSPEKKSKSTPKERRAKEESKLKEKEPVTENQKDKEEREEENDVVAFKELRNFHKDRYMRRNKEKSESPEKDKSPAKENGGQELVEVPKQSSEPTNLPDIVVDNKDIDLRLLHPAAAVVLADQPATIAKKRPSTEAMPEKATKKNKPDKFDILFGDEDVDLRKLPQLDESTNAPPPPIISTNAITSSEDPENVPTPMGSPQEKGWAEMKEPKESPEPKPEDDKKVPSQLDLVRAKLAEATKGKDRLGRPLLYSTSTEGVKERRRTISTSEDTDMRVLPNAKIDEDFETGNDKETIKTILNQAEEQLKGGNINKEQYNTLVMQVLQLNERQKLKEAKQRESLEASKRKLQKLAAKELSSDEDVDQSSKLPIDHSPKKDQNAVTAFGDIDERIVQVNVNQHNKPAMEAPLLNFPPDGMDSDMRVPPIGPMNPNMMGSMRQQMPYPPMYPQGQFPMWRGPRPRMEEFNGPRGRGRMPPPFFRNRPPMPMPPMAMMPAPGVLQGQCPAPPYVRSSSPPPLGISYKSLPPTDVRLLEYIDRDPMKTIDIDGIPREIRFYGRTAVVMLDWDDPREIRFLRGARRITFDEKDSVVLDLNEDYTEVTIDDQTFRIRYGAPTRELYIDDRWYECFFGGPPVKIIIEDQVRLVRLDGPPPQVDIGKEKRIDLVAGKINMIVDAEMMCPVFLDAKPQKIEINGHFLTLRFVDALQTVLINEKPFKVEFGGLPKPISLGKFKHFIRFSVLPRYVKPGHIRIANMEGRQLEVTPELPFRPLPVEEPMETDEPIDDPLKNQKELLKDPEAENSNPGGLDMLASVMPSSMAPASQFSGYSLAEPLKPTNPGQIPGLDTPVEEKPPVPFFGNINVTDLFAKLVASGIVQTTPIVVETKKEEETVEKKQEEVKVKEDKTTIRKVDLLRPETLRGKQPGVVAKLYGGMQCSGCGARFPPEHTVRYSQHLDWHFRQNRRERDSARRAHSRHWHYDLSDWVQYEEIEDLEEREKSWFESQGTAGKVPEGEAIPEVTEAHEALSVPAGAPEDQFCALCGDKFDQFYDQDKEEWHLRKAVRHDDKNYHPMCFEDLKASQAKEEPIEVKDLDDDKNEPAIIDDNSQSDTDDVVEVIETESQSEATSQEPVEIPDDEDDVVLKAEPVEQVDVQDDSDTDDETTAARAARDEQYRIDIANVKIKQEPVDPDDEPIITAEEELETAKADTAHAEVQSSIDGNLQFEASTTSAPTLPSGGIRININQPIQTVSTMREVVEEDRLFSDISMEDEPLPPGEEPELEYKLKPSLEGVQFSRQPPVQRGNELSGLCSIM